MSNRSDAGQKDRRGCQGGPLVCGLYPDCPVCHPRDLAPRVGPGEVESAEEMKFYYHDLGIGRLPHQLDRVGRRNVLQFLVDLERTARYNPVWCRHVRASVRSILGGLGHA